MTITTQFELKDRVVIPQLGLSGVIVAIWMGDIGLQYSVRYFDNAEAKTVYFFEWELTKSEAP